jgi:L-aminopeptidase/D-esterase-like protein
VAGVDVRGGAPGTRETDLLRPENLIERVHAICLSGGSAYGLAAADGVMHGLAERGIGFTVGDAPGWVVPIVPAAVIFDLGRGGRFDLRPDAEFGRRALEAATARAERSGAVGAGTGALAGGLQGGVGSSSVVSPTGVTVAALAVVNAAGSVVDPDTGLPWMLSTQRGPRLPADERRAVRAFLVDRARRSTPPANTTIGVVATDADLTKAECARLAGAAQDGLARVVRPAHSMHDGDTVFAIATSMRHAAPIEAAPSPSFRASTSRAAHLNVLLALAADVFAAACTRALLTAQSHRGGPPAVSDLAPSLRPWFVTKGSRR